MDHHGLWQPPKATRAAQQAFSPTQGKFFHSSMHFVLKVAGVVHIWYYIPVCTIFAQQFNGDVFRTKFHNPISRSQNPTPISKEDYSTLQSDELWRQSEDSSRIPTTFICRSWVGTLFRIIKKGKFSRGIKSIQSVVKASSISILLDNSIHPYRPHSINLYGLGPIGPFHIPL
ncbi:hypothetical protein O181_076245, partial [Austropuccinia psidii MF-1]|nr:hypothetical protein [Austropuccinia psidii MF-1]